MARASAVVRLPPTADTPVAHLAGVGPDRAARLAKLGIVTVRDLLYHLPRRYDDTREVTPVAELQPGATQTARVTVRSVSRRVTQQRRPPHRRMTLLRATLVDAAGGVVEAVWFNQDFLAGKLQGGAHLLVSGLVQGAGATLSFRNPKFEPVTDGQRDVGTLAAVYPETDKLSSKNIRDIVRPVLTVALAIPDRLPPAVRAAEGLMPIGEALREVHAPTDDEAARRARERIAFEEQFLLQLAAQRARRRRLTTEGIAIPYDVEVARAFTRTIPFRLTDGQRVAAHQVLTDMAAPGPMNRLLQGDVGSGKTAVAALAALMTRAAGLQTAVMAPTEILARQHHVTLTELLGPHDMAPRLLVGSTPLRARREIVEAIGQGRDPLLVGTHALIEEEVTFQDLGLVVVDEQHRFGVAQRQRLRRKAARIANFLAMTATPIPRSLSLTVYGDVDISELREMPPGRIPVVTRVVPPHQRGDAYAFIRDQVTAGRQVFVICPLIEENDKLGVRSATAEYERLSVDVFPDLRVELLHGRMRPREKQERMDRFARGDADLLVSTSVIEVGVDVPNATVMVIEGAERFGLAQLHQFRGRVGRGADRSFCLLFQGSIDDEGSDRLATVAATSSGFDLAEADLRMRGAGDVAGLRQHGLPEMAAADLLDVAMLERTRAAAAAWLDRDPELTEHAPLREAMHGFSAVFDLD